MTAVFKREFKAYFITPLGYIFLAAFFLVEGLFFKAVYSAGLTDVPSIVMAMETIIIFILPFLTMRMLSEDRRLKVDQVLMTAPVPVRDIILGKFFAAFAVYAIAFIPTFIFEIIISFHVKPNWGIYLYALFGILLLGATLISIGMFISSLTTSTAIAAVLTIVANVFIMLLSNFAQVIGAKWLTAAAKYVAFIDRVQNFGEGVMSVPDIVYFLSITAAFVFLTVHFVERRRWA